MNSNQHKILSNFIISTVTLLGFESLSVMIGLNQLSVFRTTAIYLFLMHIFWIAFMFDLHLKHSESVTLTSAKLPQLMRQALILRFKHFLNWKYVKHFFNYFILPSILYWSTVVLLFLNPFQWGLKQVIVLASTFAYCLNYLHMKEHLSAKLEAAHSWLKVLSVTKLIVAFEAYAAVIGFSWYFALDRNIVFYFVLAVTFFLIHQALFTYNYRHDGLILGTLLAAIVVGWTGTWVYHNWTYQYFTAALMLLALYNTIWGFIHHIFEKTFTSRIALEYFILGLLVVSIILATHNFDTRIV